MSPVACPFPDCSRYAGHPGRCVPAGLVPPPVGRGGRADLDRCWPRADGTCGRVGHPTTRSTCNQETRP